MACKYFRSHRGDKFVTTVSGGQQRGRGGQGVRRGAWQRAVCTARRSRLRDGDRFWFENAGFDPRDLAILNRVTLSEIMARNSGVQGLQPSIFFVRQP